MSKVEQVAELAAILAKESRKVPYHVAARDAVALRRIADGAARWAVLACNGVQRYDSKARQVLATWTGEDEARKDRADEKAMAKASEIAKRYRARVTIGGDPRGCILRLHFRSGMRNGMGDGWGVA